jgi:DNA ligase-1
MMNFFDMLYADGKSKLALPYVERRQMLKNILKSAKKSSKLRLIKQIVADSPQDIDQFMEQAMKDGCEGVMIKQLSSTYRSGAREYAWVKLKREYRTDLADTLDLVIIGALHGHGRRVGKYGALLLAAYDPKNDKFQSATKVGTGFTDKHLDQFYKDLERHLIGRRHPRVETGMEMDVWFEPKVVIEIISSEITVSPAHAAAKDSVKPGFGLALRFPKFTGKIRDDKNPEDATTVHELLDMYRKQLKIAGSSGRKS